jgi:hypothetical protein
MRGGISDDIVAGDGSNERLDFGDEYFAMSWSRQNGIPIRLSLCSNQMAHSVTFDGERPTLSLLKNSIMLNEWCITASKSDSRPSLKRCDAAFSDGLNVL